MRVTVYFDEAGVGLVHCTRAVFGSATGVHGPVPDWMVQAKTRWLPDYIRIELDAFGIPVLPAHHVTSLVERRHVWQRHIKMDSVTRAIVMGQLCYPRTCWRITPSYLPNHKSWEVDEVKQQLGRKMAAYFFQGAAEAILPGQRPPTIVEPIGSVPKKGPDKVRDISDAREGNKSIHKWGTRLFTARPGRLPAVAGDPARLRHQRRLPHLHARGLHGQAGVGLGDRRRAARLRRRC